MAETDLTTTAPTTDGSQRLVLRNALLLVVAQALSMPISILVSATMARYLGAEEFGYLYLASTFVGLAFLFVDWGQSGTLPAIVARDRSRAGEILGSGFAWRLIAAPLTYALLAVGCHALGYSGQLQIALALQALVATIASVIVGCQDTVRGFERTDIAARSMVALPLLNLLIVVPVLVLGGRLKEVLLANAAVNALVLVFVARALRPVGVGALRVTRKTVHVLLVGGWPFLFFGVTMALQPNIDAFFLSRLAPLEAVGWHAAAVKLLGALVFPAAALISALYPTLCRLHAEDQAAFRETTSGALRTASLLSAPLAFGTFLFADDAIRIYSRDSFGPAADNLRFLAPLILLMYFSMPLGSSLLASGRQRAWAGVQMLCVVTSLALDPVLVPWFQQRMGNGGLGICVAAVVSEVLMVTGGLWLLPKGIVNSALARSIGLTLASGLGMTVVARLLSGGPAWIAAPCSVLAYLALLWAMGGIDKQQLALVLSVVDRKMSGRSLP